MQKLIMYKGLPASGKSTEAKKIVANADTKTVRINKDLLRAMLHGGVHSKGNEKVVLSARNAFIGFALGNGLNVIVDDTNLAPYHETDLRKIAGHVRGTEFEVKDFTNVPLEECLRRDKQRVDSVGADVILGMYNKYLKPPVPVIEHDPNLPDIVICDIDGTVALANGRNPFDETKVSEDLVNMPVVDMLAAYLENSNTNLIYFSGRTDGCKEGTYNWLKKLPSGARHFIGLHMRKSGDNRADYIVKKEMYEQFILGKYNVVAIFDDRPSVCRMWKSLGLPLFNVGTGEEF